METLDRRTTWLFPYIGALVVAVYSLSKMNLCQRTLTWLRQKWFAFFMDVFLLPYNQVMEETKQELFSSLKGGKVLEIGVGSGANLKYYPPGTKLVVYEPNECFKSYLETNLSKHENVTLERFVVGVSEDMKDIPDDSIPTVVSTLVLCSVADAKPVLKEILRVLKPGGKFYFLEHVVAEKWTILYYVQYILDTFWWIVFDGCSLTKRTWEDIERSGFRNITQKTFYTKRTLCGFSTEVIRRHVVGTATK